MDEDRFRAEVYMLIDRANLNQFAVSTILQELAEEQMAEWDDREECEPEE